MHSDSLTKIGYAPGTSVRNNVSEFLRELAENKPNRILLQWPQGENHGEIRAQDLWNRVIHTAAGFVAAGIESGDRVLIFLPMSLPMYTAMFALQHLGAIPVFLDGWARRGELGVSAEIADPKGVVSFPQAFSFFAGEPILERIPLAFCLGADISWPGKSFRFETLMETPSKHPTCAVESEHTALITFTTGSSGRPKGADRTHRFLAAQHYALNRHLPYNESDVDLPVFPIFSLNNLAAGVTTVLPNIDLAKPSDNDASAIVQQLLKQKVTCTTLSPWLFRAVAGYCQDQGIVLSTLRRMVTGGAPVARDEVALMQKMAPHAQILVLYGSTEVEPIAHISAQEWLTLRTPADKDPEWVDFGVNVGHLDPGLQWYFAPIGDSTIQAGEPGELIVSGEHVCRGYFRDPTAFSRAKIVDAQGVVWHRTGDVGYVDEREHLWLVGRVHNTIRHSSGWLFPVRAELVLKKVPQIARVAFVAMPGKGDLQEAWCVLQPQIWNPIYTQNDGPETQAWCLEVTRLMAKNKIPFDHIRFVENIPMDARHHSKVEYNELRQLIIQSEGTSC